MSADAHAVRAMLASSLAALSCQASLSIIHGADALTFVVRPSTVEDLRGMHSADGRTWRALADLVAAAGRGGPLPCVLRLDLSDLKNVEVHPLGRVRLFRWPSADGIDALPDRPLPAAEAGAT